MDNRITNSQLNADKTCSRKHFWSYVAFGTGIKRDQDVPVLSVGSAVHEAIDVFVKAKMRGERDMQTLTALAMEASVGEFNKTYRADFHEGDEETWFKNREVVRALVAAYCYRWAEVDHGVEWLESERELDAPIINPATLRPMRGPRMSGKIDKLFRRRGKIVLRDHKTTADQVHPGSPYFHRLLIDSQMSHYVLALSRMGIHVDEIEYDVIRKPLIKPKRLSAATCEEIAKTQKHCGHPVKFRRDGDRAWVDGDLVDVNRTAKKFTFGETYRMFFLRLYSELTNPDGQNRYFLRHIVPRTANMMDEYAQDVYESARLLREKEKNKWWPKNTSECTKLGTCPFLRLCAAGIGVDADPDELPRGYCMKRSPHEELDADPCDDISFQQEAPE